MTSETPMKTAQIAADPVAPQATAEVWDAFHQGLSRFLRARVGADDAEDIEQEVFLRIHKSLQGGVMPRNISGWVHQIARNAVIDHYRRRGADPTIVDANPEDERAVELEAFDAPGGVDELGRCVRPMVDNLPAVYRDALILTAFDGLSQVAAAEAAGISISGMKSRVQRGRRLLASEFRACCELQFDGRGALMTCGDVGC